MMKKKILFILVLCSLMSFAQKQLKGTFEPFSKDIKWVMLYQIKDGRQHYIKNTKIDNKSFYFEMPKEASSGMYRIVYRLKGEGFLDFLYNKEDVTLKFNPDYPEESVVYEKSRENKMYQEYLVNILGAQQYLDSLQIAYFRDPRQSTATTYQETYYELKDLQKEYQNKSKSMLAFNFIQATQRYNSKTVVEAPQAYLENIKINFFEHIDFQDPILINSSFLVDRTIDYIFNLNYSQDKSVQQNLYKESIKNVIEIPKKTSLQKDLIQIIIEEFVKTEDTEMVRYVLDNYYKNLPKELQSDGYISETLAKISVVVGAIAPDFKWGKNKQLSTLNTHKNYVVVFWSTGCSHCKKQLPELYRFLEDYKDIQVVAVALEKEDTDFKKLVPNFKGWEHVLGMGKWKNEIAQSYSIESTPTFILLNANKRIIALPDNFSALKENIKALQQ